MGELFTAPQISETDPLVEKKKGCRPERPGKEVMRARLTPSKVGETSS